MLFFGDLFSAGIATVGLNPSYQEYTDAEGALLTGMRQRLPTLGSLGAGDRRSLDDAQCDRAIEWMSQYYRPGQPVYRWFAPLQRVVAGLGGSYVDGTAVHIDLVQEATNPTWSALRAADRVEHERLLAADLPFLEWQARSFPLKAVVCTGRTVSEHVCQRLKASVAETGSMALIRWWVGSAEVDGRRVGLAGWNIPLQRATGLGTRGEHELGMFLKERLRL